MWGQRLAVAMRDLQPTNSTEENSVTADSHDDLSAKAKGLLPIMQHALEKLWEETPADVFDVG